MIFQWRKGVIRVYAQHKIQHRRCWNLLDAALWAASAKHLSDVESH